MKEILPQLFGYLATVMLAISLLVNNDIKFRWLNGCGGVCFIIYGAFIGATPVMLTNGLLLSINIYYLIKIYRTEEDFDLIEFQLNDQFVKKYLSFYSNDIKDYFPNYKMEDQTTELRFVVLRDMAFANVFAAHISMDGTAYVKINYTVPKYRDYEVGKFIFEKERKFLLSKGIQRIAYSEVTNENHAKFLKVMGFKWEIHDGREWYLKDLA
ncbi:MAG: YgjV family protein [Bacteroidetes bacterium]|nr:YgjV family protein [Bacteroidota bacterium]